MEIRDLTEFSEVEEIGVTSEDRSSFWVVSLSREVSAPLLRELSERAERFRLREDRILIPSDQHLISLPEDELRELRRLYNETLDDDPASVAFEALEEDVYDDFDTALSEVRQCFEVLEIFGDVLYSEVRLPNRETPLEISRRESDGWYLDGPSGGSYFLERIRDGYRLHFVDGDSSRRYDDVEFR